MRDRYFELISNMKANNHNFTMFAEKILICMENRDLKLQRDINYFQNSCLLSAFDHNQHTKIDEGNYKKVKEALNLLGSENRLISCNYDFNDFIISLFRPHKNTIFGLGCNIIFYSLKNKKSRFLEEFFQRFDVTIIKSSLNLTYYLNLKRLNKPTVTFDSVDELLKNIYRDNEKGNYYISDKFSQENLTSLETGKPLKFPYSRKTIKEKYILLKSLIHINEKENLPSNTIRKIIENLENQDYITTFNYYYYDLICKYKKIENFQHHEHRTLDEALSFAIELEEKNIRGYLIEFTRKYYICYENETKFEPSKNIEKNKKKVIEKIQEITSKDYILTQYSLKDLINIQVFNNKPILESSKEIYDGKALPMDLVLNKGINMYNITGNLLDFKDKNYLKYNRSNFNLNKKIDIDLIEKIDDYYTVIIYFESIKLQTQITYDRDFYIPDRLQDFKRGITKSINKGYLLSDTGVVRYTTTSELKLIDISFPWWFVSETEDQFLFLINFFETI